jgi:hypothetical protein
MAPELILALPGPPIQVIVLERVDQDLRLVQPGGVGGRIAGPPPAVAPGEVPLRSARCMARSPSGSGRRLEFPVVRAKSSIQAGSARRRSSPREGQLLNPLCTTRNTSMFTVRAG